MGAWRAAINAMARGAPCCVLAGCVWSASASAASLLPPEVDRALQRARIPEQAVSVVLLDAATGTARLSLHARQAMNPASLSKLFTTAAALDLLGPAWTWSTPVWLHGPVHDGVLDGSLHIRGSGDPKLVHERVWLLLRRVQQMGVREIRGDIVLDSSAFSPAEGSAADFDGEALRPYNVRPDALLLNYKAQVLTFVPDQARRVARVYGEPALAGAQVERTVPLSSGPCDDWRSALMIELSDPSQPRFKGSFPAACGEQVWPLADPQPASYNARLLAGLWREMGGTLGGRVRDGPAPADARPAFELRSPPLLDIVRDINKFSNNVMAQQLFLTLALQRDPARPATVAAARALVRGWVSDRLGEPGAELVLDNGSGLSREGRASARLLARLLQHAFDGPWWAELASSLPVGGVDGTLRRQRTPPGRVHLKTGSLRDVVALAGYVLSDSGRRYVLVAIVNHAQARGAWPALEGLVQWVLRDAPLR
jgi:D-alanyl-D-alanine carboxypeptidase/D-alanyl-D-alanine-endopeptidase (penicillin-binding protein 4)